MKPAYRTAVRTRPWLAYRPTRTTSVPIHTAQLPSHLRPSMTCATRLDDVVSASQNGAAEPAVADSSTVSPTVARASTAAPAGQTHRGVRVTTRGRRSAPPRTHHTQPSTARPAKTTWSPAFA